MLAMVRDDSSEQSALRSRSLLGRRREAVLLVGCDGGVAEYLSIVIVCVEKEECNCNANGADKDGVNLIGTKEDFFCVIFWNVLAVAATDLIFVCMDETGQSCTDDIDDDIDDDDDQKIQ